MQFFIWYIITIVIVNKNISGISQRMLFRRSRIRESIKLGKKFLLVRKIKANLFVAMLWCNPTKFNGAFSCTYFIQLCTGASHWHANFFLQPFQSVIEISWLMLDSIFVFVNRNCLYLTYVFWLLKKIFLCTIYTILPGGATRKRGIVC